MIYKEVEIKGQKETAILTMYVLDNYESIDINRIRPIVVICPGGGYNHVSNREAEAVAIRINGMGLHAAVLKYSVKPAVFPEALIQLAEAVAYVREHAGEYYVDAEQIYTMGFSAGGHLACCLSAFWNTDWLPELVGREPAQLRPNRQILCYPVITSGEYAHEDSFIDLTGGVRQDNPELWDRLSLEKQVTEDMPSTFIWHTMTDGLVPVENSLMLVSALHREHVPVEAHLYEDGKHGLSLANEEVEGDKGRVPNPRLQSWIRLLETWLK